MPKFRITRHFISFRESQNTRARGDPKDPRVQLALHIHTHTHTHPTGANHVRDRAVQTLPELCRPWCRCQATSISAAAQTSTAANSGQPSGRPPLRPDLEAKRRGSAGALLPQPPPGPTHRAAPAADPRRSQDGGGRAGWSAALAGGGGGRGPAAPMALALAAV